MRVSVLIPTRGRDHKLARCLALLARQSHPKDQFEVLVGIDGGSPPEALGAPGLNLRVFAFDHAGPAATRNRLLSRASGEFVLLLNDDVRPDRDLIAAHVRAHQQRRVPAMILGAAPFVRHTGDTMWDRLIRETSMVFFYDRMHAAIAGGIAGPDHDWGFRHAWTLNLSMPKELLLAVDGFNERLRYAMFEDLDMAFRVQARGARHATPIPVLYRPEAIVEHDHRISVQEYLDRERQLGRAAWDLAEISPECAHAVFNRDLRAQTELEECERVIASGVDDARAIRTDMDLWAKAPAGDQPPIAELYQRHLPLKRRTFREGLLDAAGQIARRPSLTS